MLYSDLLKIRTQNQVNILPPKLIWGGGREDVNLIQFKNGLGRTLALQSFRITHL